MNTFLTIGYKASGKSEVLATPDIPYAEQRALFKTLTGDFTDVELWSRSMGKIKQRKVKASKESKVPKLAKTSNTSKSSKE